MSMNAILKADAISKRFGGTVVVDSASLALPGGRVHALVGENGAGKSTMIKMLSGAEKPDDGRLLLEGKEVSFRAPADAAAARIATVYQELDIIDDLTVGQNVMLAREPMHGPFLRNRELNRRASIALQRAGSAVAPGASPRSLSLAQQQRIVIARALMSDARVLILDEPTAALGPQEVEDLFSLVRGLVDDGVAVLFVSHRLDEVLELADDITVMRDGQVVHAGLSSQFDEHALVTAMTGRRIDLTAMRTPALTHDGRPALQISALPLADGHLDLAVHPGEIVGIAGLAGSGRSRLLRNIVGAPWIGGRVHVEETPHDRLDPSAALRAGIGYLPEDRKRDGLVLDADAPFNVSLSSLVAHRPTYVTESRDRARLATAVERMSLRGNPQGAVGRLSGGNQQKVLLARILATRPKVLLLDEPTRGVDIGAKSELWAMLEQIASEGVAIVMVSSELPEILRLSDRILVLSDGRLAGDFPSGTDQATIIRAALPRRTSSASLPSMETK